MLFSAEMPLVCSCRHVYMCAHVQYTPHPLPSQFVAGAHACIALHVWLYSSCGYFSVGLYRVLYLVRISLTFPRAWRFRARACASTRLLANRRTCLCVWRNCAYMTLPQVNIRSCVRFCQYWRSDVNVFIVHTHDDDDDDNVFIKCT